MQDWGWGQTLAGQSPGDRPAAAAAVFEQHVCEPVGKTAAVQQAAGCCRPCLCWGQTCWESQAAAGGQRTWQQRQQQQQQRLQPLLQQGSGPGPALPCAEVAPAAASAAHPCAAAVACTAQPAASRLHSPLQPHSARQRQAGQHPAPYTAVMAADCPPTQMDLEAGGLRRAVAPAVLQAACAAADPGARQAPVSAVARCLAPACQRRPRLLNRSRFRPCRHS